MSNTYQELLHFVSGNTAEVVCRNWAKDLRRMEESEHQRDQLAEALRVAMKSLSTYGNHPIIEDKARAALKALEDE